MKRLVIGLVAVAGLLGSVLALVASTSSHTSGQIRVQSLTLTNSSTTDRTTTPPQTAEQEQIRVTLASVQGCTPSQGSASVTQVLNPGSSIFPVVDRNCNWSITFGHTTNLCVATATIQLTVSGGGTATVLATGNPTMPTITLIGLPTGLQTTLETAASVGARAAARQAGSAEPAAVNATGTLTSISFSVDAASTTSCATTFTPAATITLPGTSPSDYAGLEFEVTFTTDRTGRLAPLCTSGTSTYVVSSAGAIAAKRDSNNRPMVANLVDKTLGDLAGTGRCTYTASFTPEVGSLWLARNARGILRPTYPSGRSNISGETPGTTNTVSITYAKISVPIVVRSTFPSDEVFTTEDRVDYTVSVNSPCGGYLAVLPAGIGNQGDSASSQVFPGTVLVYGSGLSAITQGVTASRSYSVDAYQDALGTRVCSVTVTEDSGPERCSVVGGSRQSDTYAAGKTALTFEFNHVCEPAGVVIGETDDGSEGPPAPPEIDLGLGDPEETDPPSPPPVGEGETTAPSGPQEEGRTG